jgi:hypothetical protein
MPTTLASRRLLREAGVKLLRDLIGRRVVLARAITTRGGDHYPVGTELVIGGAWRGRIHLKKVNGCTAVRGVELSDVAIVPKEA